jgi:hypothetical protein
MVMNDFESTLSAALQTAADDAVRALDTVNAARRMETRLDRVEQERRRLAWGTVIAVAAAMVLAIAVVLAVGQTHPTTPEPGRPARHVGGGEVLAQQPFLTNNFDPYWHVVRRKGARPPRLSRCVTDPQTWGADKTQAATYIDPNPSAHDSPPDTRVNEYLLQYGDATAAQGALLGAFHQLKGCPLPAGGVEDPLTINHVSSPRSFEFFAQQRQWSNHGLRVYVLRVARAGNVLLVLEDTGIPSDRSPTILKDAVSQALRRPR